MRDASRIERTLQLLHYIWREQPDTRFNQLIHNLQVEYSFKNENYGQQTIYKKEERSMFTIYAREHQYDFFNLEDDLFVEFLEEKVRDAWKI